MRFIKTFKKYNYFLSQLIEKEIKLKYRSSYLGVLWTMLEPLLTMVVLVFVFKDNLGKDTLDFPVYILSGRLVYSFFQRSTSAALKSVRSHASMIKKIYVPKYMYPLTSIISNYVTFLISLIVLAGVIAVRGIRPTWHIFEAVIPLAIILVLCLGLGLILSSFAVFFGDLEYLWSVFTMIVMYASAIFYSADSMMTGMRQWLFKLNPVYACIFNFRNAIFGAAQDWQYNAYSGAVAVVCLIAGLYVFYKEQDRFVLHL